MSPLDRRAHPTARVPILVHALPPEALSLLPRPRPQVEAQPPGGPLLLPSQGVRKARVPCGGCGSEPAIQVELSFQLFFLFGFC